MSDSYDRGQSSNRWNHGGDQQRGMDEQHRERSRERSSGGYHHRQQEGTYNNARGGRGEYYPNNTGNSQSNSRQDHYQDRGHHHDSAGANSHSQTNNGGVNLQQYTRNDTHTNDNQGWETVSTSRNQRPQELRGGSWQQQQHTQTTHNYHPNDAPPFMLMLVGIPGSGKSTFAKSLESAAPQRFVRINQDALGNRKRCEQVTRQTLASQKICVIDRCNFNPAQRRYFLDIAREFCVPVDCISLELPKEECVRRCESRPNHETIQRGEERQVVNKMMSMFEAPHMSEGFRRVQRVSREEHVNELMVEYSGGSVGGGRR